VNFTLSIRPEAEADMAEQFDWNEARKAGLGYDFLAEVRAVLRLIEENPLRHAEAYRKTRRALVHFRSRCFICAMAKGWRLSALSTLEGIPSTGRSASYDHRRRSWKNDILREERRRKSSLIRRALAQYLESN
jgi:hypothetical protein